MRELDVNHVAVWAAMDAYQDSLPGDVTVSRERMCAALNKALPLLDVERPPSLQATPVGQELLAKAYQRAQSDAYSTALSFMSAPTAAEAISIMPNPYLSEDPHE